MGKMSFITVSASLLMLSQLSAAPLKVEELKTMNFFKNQGISILGTAEINENLTLVSILAQTPQGAQRMNAFVTNDKKNIIFGGGYNDETGQQLVVATDMSIYQKDAAFSFGKGKKEIYVFSDPECPYCKKLDLEVLANLSREDYTVYFYLFPLSFHKNAEAMSLYILSHKSSEEKIKALHSISNNATEYEKASYTDAERKRLKELLDKQMQIAQTLGVSGTPALFDAQGSPINWSSLMPKK